MWRRMWRVRWWWARPLADRHGSHRPSSVTIGARVRHCPDALASEQLAIRHRWHERALLWTFARRRSRRSEKFDQNSANARVQCPAEHLMPDLTV